MSAVISPRSSYDIAAMKMRVQVGLGLLGCTVTALNIADVNPLALGMAMHTVLKMVELAVIHFPNHPPTIIAKDLVAGIIFCAAYTGFSGLDQRIQAMGFTTLLLVEIKRIGIQNVWPELERVPSDFQKPETNRTPSQRTVRALQLHFSSNLVAFIATALKVADIRPLALGIIAAVNNLIPDNPVKDLPIPLQILVLGTVTITAYSLTSTFDPRLQVIAYLGVIVLNIIKIRPQNVWKELIS